MKKVFVTCLCGNIIETYPCRLNRKKYCSKKCLYRFRKRPSGLLYDIKVKNKGWFKFKGGHINKHGYVIIKADGKIRTQHKYILERYLGRNLQPNEVTHHIDGNKTNNNINNLVVMTKKQHDMLHNGKKICLNACL